MIRFYHTMRQVLNGTRAIDNKLKYLTIGFSVAAIHFFFTVTFGVLHIPLLFWYNAAVTVYYFFVSIAQTKKEQFLIVYFVSFVEILFHSTMASLLLGWNWGFMIYTIALVTVVFYLSYTLLYFQGKIGKPAVLSVITTVCFVTVRLVTNHIEPLYAAHAPEWLPEFFYIFNALVAFFMLLVFSILFSLEIRYMQRQLEQENRSLGQIANYDPLTHLLNRRSMNTHLKDAMERAEDSEKEFCLVMADIDDFKRVNDTYGHDCGDEILITVADIVSCNVRENDYVCRWGGEEILVLLNTDLVNSVKVAERICKEVAATIVHYKGDDVRVTLTLGVAMYRSGETIRSLMEIADQNLYKGKHNGKNQVVY